MNADPPQAGSAAERHLFGEALSCSEELPVRWRPQPLSPVACEQAAEHAEALLRTLALVEENFSDDPEERGTTDMPMHRVEAKLQVLLELVGSLVARHSDLPPTLPVRWSRQGLCVWQPAVVDGEVGLVDLQLLPWLPQLLSLPCRRLDAVDENGGQRLWLAFDPLSSALEASLERHLFRRHRRAVSATRRQR